MQNDWKLSKVMGQNTDDMKVVQKLFPIMVNGQTIDVGKCFEFGPVPMILVDHDGCICVDVIEIPETIKIIEPASHYRPGFYRDRVIIGTLKIHVPYQDHRIMHKLKFHVVCDFTSKSP